MENYFQFALIPHIISGFLALVVAPVAMMVKKGGKVHRFWGKLFFYSITMVAITGMIMSIWTTNIFMIMVAIFSFYLAASGYRSLYRKKVNGIKDVAGVDWLLLVVSGIFSLAMIGLGVRLLWVDIGAAFGYISSVFGLIGTSLVIADFRSFTIPGHHREKWLNHHITGMLGAYIATVSAFSVVNFEFMPGLVRWLWPTVIGVPIVIMMIRRYTQKPAVKAGV